MTFVRILRYFKSDRGHDFLQRVRIARNADRRNTQRLSVRLSVCHVSVFCPDD